MDAYVITLTILAPLCLKKKAFVRCCFSPCGFSFQEQVPIISSLFASTEDQPDYQPDESRYEWERAPQLHQIRFHCKHGEKRENSTILMLVIPAKAGIQCTQTLSHCLKSA